MGTSSATQLVLGAAVDFGYAAVVVLGSVITLSLGFFIFRWGWKTLLRMAGDQSLSIGGYYLRNLPYKGYSRWHSKKWNMEHMP